MRVAVIGGGWAGLAAAVASVQRGHQVELYEMAPQLGGRARRVDADGLALDNGQHILIGAYRDTLALMRTVGVDLDAALLRTPLRLVDAAGHGLALGQGRPVPALLRAVLGQPGWTLGERLGLLRAATGWALSGFRCDSALSVAQLARGLPRRAVLELIEPLCVAALNTPADAASAAVFLRVLRDALFSGPGASDLLLPRQPLSALFPEPAAAWLRQHGATLRLGRRVQSLWAAGPAWDVDGERYDRVILAASTVEAARLAGRIAPAWAATARALRHQPIVTVYLHSDGVRLPEPMLALNADADRRPAQFVFDLGQLQGQPGRLAFVVSGAADWVARGSDAAVEAVRRQAGTQLERWLVREPSLLRVVTEKRATFACLPGLARPAAVIAPGLLAAADYVQGPYPATLEGAVRSGLTAARAC